MKVKKKILSVLLAGAMLLSLVACGDSKPVPADATKSSETVAKPESSEVVETVVDPTGGQLVDGKFAETRKITVEIYDRGNDNGSDPTNNMYTKYIKDGMLADYNVEVEFVAVNRWTETDEINNLLAAGDAPDICLTYSYPTIQTYANMGGVIDLSEYLTDDYKELFPNLWNWLGDTNLNWNKDPKTGTVWAIEGKRANIRRINTFVRQDWLDTLGLSAPKTTQEFEDMLKAFNDNAETLLGADADKMVPFSLSFDVGWRAANLIDSFIDPKISDKEYYVNGFDDRKLTQNGTKDAVKLLNKWYNDGLIWKDFALYPSGDTTEDNMMKAGYVGAFIHNWDYPFRNGVDSINANLQRLVGENAKFVAIDCFQDANGNYTKYSYSTAGDRKLFFPTTNDEPLASMLYLEWISDPEHIQYLQIGDEGVTHQVLDDGAIQILAATGDAIQNSGQNIDMTITCNGLNLTDPNLTVQSLAYSYAEIDPALVVSSAEIALKDATVKGNVNVGTIDSEDGMGPNLSAKRDVIFDTSVVAPVDQFDSIWDSGIADFLSSGGQAISDERAEKWIAVYGDVDNLP